MVENWIKLEADDDKCRLVFAETCNIILDDDDVDYLVRLLENYQFKRILEYVLL